MFSHKNNLTELSLLNQALVKIEIEGENSLLSEEIWKKKEVEKLDCNILSLEGIWAITR